MAVALQCCPALVLGHRWANTPLWHPKSEDRLPAHLWAALVRRGRRLEQAVVSALPRWVCTKVFEPISTQPRGSGTSFPPGLFHRCVTSPFSPAGGKDTSPATTSLKPEIPWRSLSKRGHRDLASCTWLETFSILFCYSTQPVSPAWLGHSPSSTTSDSPQPQQPSLPCSLHRLSWLGQGQTGLGTEVAVEISLMAVSLFQVVLKEHHSEPSGATAETGGKCCLLRLGLSYTPALHGLSSH